MFRIHSRITNEEVLNQVRQERALLSTILLRILKFLGSVIPPKSRKIYVEVSFSMVHVLEGDKKKIGQL